MRRSDRTMPRGESLVGLGDGVYSVREVVRILQPSMTSRKVHHWLHTGLLGEVLRPESQGRPTLLTFEQLLKVRTLQHLRAELGFSLQRVRRAIEWILAELFAEDWHQLHFYRTGIGEVGITDANGREAFAVSSGQRVMETTLPELDEFLEETRSSWERGVLGIEGFPLIESNTRVMSGAPVIVGTRIETAFVAHLAQVLDLVALRESFEHVDSAALEQAARFEGVHLAA